jgi:dCMP deaminase
MEMAEMVGGWSNCMREDRKIGAVAVRDKRVICTSYNSSPVGVRSCTERGECLRKKRGIASGTALEVCYAVDSEQALICNAALQGLSLKDSTVYCTHQPCVICLKMLINAGVAQVIFKHEYPDAFSREIANEVGFKLLKIKQQG